MQLSNDSPQLSFDDDGIAELSGSFADVLTTECDSQKLHGFVDGDTALANHLWNLASSLGWLAVGLPEAYGGIGMGPAGLAVLYRELGRRLAPGPFMSTLVAGQWLLAHGSEQQKRLYLPRLASAELKAAIPASGSRDASGLRLENGCLSGETGNLLGAADAALAIVPVTGADNILSWGVVAIDANSAQLSKESCWDLTRNLCSLRCKAAPVEIVSSPLAGATLDLHLALAICWDSVGGADSIIHQTVAYLKGRSQFDRVLASFQALKHRVANLMAELTTSQHLARQALESLLSSPEDALMWTTIAKSSITDAYAFATQDCLQLHGGVGYTWEYDCHLFLKRARLNRAMAGSNGGNLDRAMGALGEAVASGRAILELPL